MSEKTEAVIKLIDNICKALDCGELQIVDKFLELKSKAKKYDANIELIETQAYTYVLNQKIKQIAIDMLNDEQMLRRYTEQLEKEGIATLPLRSFLMHLGRIQSALIPPLPKSERSTE